MTTRTQQTNDSDIKQLNAFLRGELAAVETYNQCLSKVRTPTLSAELETLRRSHEARVRALQDRVRGLGGSPVHSSGVWGSFAKLVEGGAKALGESAAIAALEEGEDHGRDDYQRNLSKLSPATQSFVEGSLLPEQMSSHAALSRLKKTLS